MSTILGAALSDPHSRRAQKSDMLKGSRKAGLRYDRGRVTIRGEERRPRVTHHDVGTRKEGTVSYRGGNPGSPIQSVR